MGTKRRKIQLELALSTGDRGEAPKSGSRGTVVSRAEHVSESTASTEQLIEEVCRRENVRKALQRVKRNKGKPGVDGMTVEELPGYLKEHWSRIRERLLTGTYKPQPVRRTEIPKRDGGRRSLGVPTALDRFIQQAVLQVLQSRWDPTFSEHSFGFRPNRSAHQAVAQAQEYVRQGYQYVVDIDLEKFFDRVNHDMLMGRAAKRVEDKRLLKLLRAYLNAGVMENGLVSPTDEGTPQGGPLSPLLSNLMLDDLDRELEKRGHRFVRYADDCNIYVRSERAGQRVMESISRFITDKLKLKINRRKSRVIRAGEGKFLGFGFTKNKESKRNISPEALKRFRERVRKITRRTRGISLEKMVSDLRPYLIGWRNYFGFCETGWQLKLLDSWIRRRLRSVAWKQWKRGRRRFAELRKRGIDKRRAAEAASCSQHGPWRMSTCPTLHTALSNAYFYSLGLPLLSVRRVA